MDNDIKIGENGIVTLRWNVKSVDYSPEKCESLREKFAKKYNIPVKNVMIDPQFIKSENSDESLTYEVVNNIQDPHFQQNLFWDYLKDNDITDYDKDIILDIDGQINSQIDYDSFEKCKQYNIKYVKWDNFLSYGPGNYFDFTKLKGLVLLNGEPANQSGKSTFSYDLIHFALHGKTSSGKVSVLSDYFNKYSPKDTEVFVEICITIDGSDYIIRRKLTRPEFGKKNRNKITQSVEYFRVENGTEIALVEDGELLNNGTTQQTNKVIKEAIGNEKDFDLVISANADNLKSLISLKDTERGRLMSRWIGLTPLEKKDEIARDMWNHNVNIGLKSSVYNRESVSDEIKMLEAQNEENAKIIESKKKVLEDTEKKLSELDSMKDEKFASLKNVDSSLLNVDVATVEAKITDTLSKGKAKKALIDQKTQELANIGNVDFSENEYKSLTDLRYALSNKITGIKSDINHLRNHNDALLKSEYCPTCGKKFDNVDNTALIEENNKKIQSLIEEGIATKAKLDEAIKNIESMESNRILKHDKDKLELQISALNAEKAVLLSQWRENVNLKGELDKNRDAIVYNNNVNNEINLLKENIKTQEKIRFDVSNEIASCQKDIDLNNGSIKEKQSLVETIINEEKIIKNWKIYLAMVGKNGISKMVLRKALPIINEETERLLEGICDFKVVVGIDENNDVTFSLVRNGVVNALSSGSGYEQTLSALALRVVLGKMSTLSKPPFLLLDEVLGGVAKDNYDNVKKLYDRIVKNYNFVFQISHLPEIKDWHDMIVTVRKNEEGISSIIQ